MNLYLIKLKNAAVLENIKKSLTRNHLSTGNEDVTHGQFIVSGYLQLDSLYYVKYRLP